MRLEIECIPCFMRQAVMACRLATENRNLQQTCLRQVANFLSEVSFSKDPPYIASGMFHLIYKICQNQDPYRLVKEEYNQKVKRLLLDLRGKVSQSSDPLMLTTKIALAGNIIDFGILENFDLDETLLQDQEVNLPLDEWRRFKKAVLRANSILFIADNAGEIGMDKLLLEEIRRANPQVNIILTVKEKPIINDATLSDAHFFKLEEISKVVVESKNYLGTHLDIASPEFRALFAKCDVVIAKGQANFESLEEYREREIFFLLKAKCPVVAQALGVELNSVVLKAGNV